VETALTGKKPGNPRERHSNILVNCEPPAKITTTSFR
jgi:hypothetical protein